MFILIEIFRAFDICVPPACVGSFIFVILGMYVQGPIYSCSRVAQNLIECIEYFVLLGAWQV